MTAVYAALGLVFGFVLSRSGAADYDFIQAMFLFESIQLYAIMGTAVVLTAPALWLIKQRGRTAFGRPSPLSGSRSIVATWPAGCCSASDGR